jgi:hypothetical protein
MAPRLSPSSVVLLSGLSPHAPCAILLTERNFTGCQGRRHHHDLSTRTRRRMLSASRHGIRCFRPAGLGPVSYRRKRTCEWILSESFAGERATDPRIERGSRYRIRNHRDPRTEAP